MSALPSSSSIFNSALEKADVQAAMLLLYDFIDQRLNGGGATEAELVATRASLKAARELQPIDASVASNALTMVHKPANIEFRSSTLTSGATNVRTVAADLSLVISAGSTLGTTSGAAARIALLAIDNAGTVELAAVNADGGFHFDETKLISTTAEGGAGAADSASVVYSNTARSNVPFRIRGYVELTQATAGQWATPPSKIQGAGGAVAQAVQGVSMVRVQGSVGNGSTNTAIVRFANVLDNIGSDITYADSATLGASFTINTPGVYSIGYIDSWSGGAINIGISRNSTQLTTDIGSITAANRLGFITTPAASVPGNAVATVFLAAGDVIRAHANPSSIANSALKQFTITRVR